MLAELSAIDKDYIRAFIKYCRAGEFMLSSCLDSLSARIGALDLDPGVSMGEPGGLSVRSVRLDSAG